jgi:hypothetical protein
MTEIRNQSLFFPLALSTRASTALDIVPREVQVKEEYLDHDLPCLVVTQAKDGTPVPRVCGFLSEK